MERNHWRLARLRDNVGLIENPFIPTIKTALSTAVLGLIIASAYPFRGLGVSPGFRPFQIREIQRRVRNDASIMFRLLDRDIVNHVQTIGA